jgi:hypothetical protein
MNDKSLPLEKRILYQEFFLKTKTLKRKIEDLVDNKKYNLQNTSELLKKENIKEDKKELLDSDILQLNLDADNKNFI